MYETYERHSPDGDTLRPGNGADRPAALNAYMFSYQYGDAIIHFAGLSFLGSYRVALLNLLLRHPWSRPPFKVLCHVVSLIAIPVLQTPLPRALLEHAYS